ARIIDIDDAHIGVLPYPWMQPQEFVERGQTHPLDQRRIGDAQERRQREDRERDQAPDAPPRLHGAARKSATSDVWSSAIRAGAWPAPAISRRLTAPRAAAAPRCVISCAVSRNSRSELAPRTTSTGAAIGSQTCQKLTSSIGALTIP